VSKHLAGSKTKAIAGAVLVAASTLLFTMASNSRTSGVTSETLLRTDSAWNGARYEAYAKGAPELTVLKITIPAHEKLSWHTHPMPNVAYVLSGEITVEEQGSAKRHFSAGQVIPEMVNTVHRGVAGDTPAVLIVFYAGVQGMPLSEPPL
jgi:quercetin dioxygenase-like cupin family protein